MARATEELHPADRFMDRIFRTLDEMPLWKNHIVAAVFFSLQIAFFIYLLNS